MRNTLLTWGYQAFTVKSASTQMRALVKRLYFRPFDVALALVVLALGYWNLWLDWDAFFPEHPPSLAVDTITTAIAALALIFRRQAPVAVLLVVGAAHFLPDLIVPTGPVLLGEWLPFLIASYSLAVHRQGWTGGLPLLVAGFGLLVVGRHYPDEMLAPAAIFMWFGQTGVAIFAGHLIGRLHRRSAQLARRSEELEWSREQEAEMAVGKERARIAREMHDIVAHKVSIMVVQAGAAENMLRQDSNAAETALRHVQAAGREALHEMKFLLGVLREESSGELRTPMPSLRRLEGLFEPLQLSGMELELTTEGTERHLPPSIDVSAYRIVQESLTNALKHAPGSRVRVRVQVEATRVSIEVLDDGATAGRPNGHGLGLIGLRERVALLGGHLHAGPHPEGGFCVKAELPCWEAGS
jgi:signal transduction histidine kinase